MIEPRHCGARSDRSVDTPVRCHQPLRRSREQSFCTSPSDCAVSWRYWRLPRWFVYGGQECFRSWPPGTANWWTTGSPPTRSTRTSPPAAARSKPTRRNRKSSAPSQGSDTGSSATTIDFFPGAERSARGGQCVAFSSPASMRIGRMFSGGGSGLLLPWRFQRAQRQL